MPPLLWRMAFALAKPFSPGANVAMGIRMMKNMTFDATPAIRDFGWNPNEFSISCSIRARPALINP